jgi:hypothetical protein
MISSPNVFMIFFSRIFPNISQFEDVEKESKFLIGPVRLFSQFENQNEYYVNCKVLILMSESF